jgi:hypothetical protein
MGTPVRPGAALPTKRDGPGATGAYAFHRGILSRVLRIRSGQSYLGTACRVAASSPPPGRMARVPRSVQEATSMGRGAVFDRRVPAELNCWGFCQLILTLVLRIAHATWRLAETASERTVERRVLGKANQRRNFAYPHVGARGITQQRKCAF